MDMELRHGTPEEAGMSAERVQHVVDLAENWVEQGIHPALVVLVARRGIIVAHEAFGRLTPEQNSPPLELDAIFPLASLSKPITATLAMILVEDGLVGLNRPVSWYIPEFTGEGKDKVMVHHLLTHTSGLRGEGVSAHVEEKRGTVEIPTPDETQHPLINEYLFLGYDAPLWKPPGTEMSYCGYGFELAAEIIRRVSGLSLDDFARKRLFEPLGMKDTFYILPDSAINRVVKRPTDVIFAGFNSLETLKTPWANGGVLSTAMDIGIYGQMFLSRGSYEDIRILSPASVDAMTRNQIPGISSHHDDGEFFPEASWGLGWEVCADKKAIASGSLYSLKTVSHCGAGGVFLWIDPVNEIVGAYFSVIGKPTTTTDGYYLMARMDLFANAVTAAIVDV